MSNKEYKVNYKYTLPQHLEDHTYSKYKEPSFILDQKYAENIGIHFPTFTKLYSNKPRQFSQCILVLFT